MSKTSDKLTLLACQIDIPKMTTAAERDVHLQATAAKIETQLSHGQGGDACQSVDLVVLPELSSIDYSRAAFGALSELAEPVDGPSFQTFSALAQRHGVHVAYGFARAGDNGHFISMGVVGPDGALAGYYDKLHLAQFGASMEKEYFLKGGHLFVHEINGFRISPIICYDIRFPELCRALVTDHEVDLILHCGAYARDASFNTWHSFAITRAMENQVYFLSLNRAGADFGSSLFCAPWHDETLPPTGFEQHAEEFKYLTLCRSTLTQARHDYTFLKDRLPSYGMRTA